ncbi:F-BOX PROTEIN WITH A DOMAIN PROTEIN [Salix purpurea]|uniref:F-BOX PROTEIN WITH A DOMAIN PROTEIN n=1 Tax=Salix purpurea TaxID=77065 RepID=A0A9Q0WHZ7_SALPP|nr:F-BOX PROTEIN WITH A DOMAIN PROTEIN [Salix purpurea]
MTTQIEKESGPKTHGSDPVVVAELYAIMEAVADRIEMHKNIGEQRDNWNHLLLNSIHAMTLTAATMCGLAAASASGEPLAGTQATGMLAIMNKIQPSQLAEEQRNASRLFKQLHGQIQTLLSVGNPTVSDVNDAMENVLALDKAYPLPLLGAMLEKYPSSVAPAVWWPQQGRKQARGIGKKIEGNGWNRELEDEMREIVGVLKRKDKADYLRLSEKALKLHKMLAFSGPLLTGLGALGSAFAGTANPWAVVLGVAGGALASIVNAMEHGGQVGMVFEMYRSNAGFFKLVEETIESNINETNVWGRENGQVFEMKVALQLGRSLSELKHLATSSSLGNIEEEEEFGSKLF